MATQKNATVKVIGGLYDGRVGKVVNTYPEIDVAVVSFEDNGDIGKVSLSALVEITPQESKIVGVKVEIPEGAKKISRNEFLEAIAQVTKPDKIIEKVGEEKSMYVGLAAVMGGVKLTERLFGEDEIIVIDKERLIHEIAGSVADEDPKFMIVGLMNGIILRGVVDILFGAENG